MASLEIVAPNARQEVQMLDSPFELLKGLEEVVKPGCTEIFDDVQWMLYMGSMERLLTETHPFMKAILNRVGDLPTDSPLARTPDLNVLPSPQDSVRRMSMVDGVGGGFYRMPSLDEYRYVLAPAHDVDKHIEIDLGHSISFDGSSLVLAMVSEGIDPEVINYRPEPDFPVFRERTIGNFFLDRALNL